MIKQNIEEELKKIRPSLQADGGDVEMVSFDEKTGTVKVKLKGACSHCPMAEMTLKGGIERVLKEKVKGVKEVEAV